MPVFSDSLRPNVMTEKGFPRSRCKPFESSARPSKETILEMNDQTGIQIAFAPTDSMNRQKESVQIALIVVEKIV